MKGDRAERWSVLLSGNWRMVFRFARPAKRTSAPHTLPGELDKDRMTILSASVRHRRFNHYGFSPVLLVPNEARRRTSALRGEYRKDAA